LGRAAPPFLACIANTEAAPPFAIFKGWGTTTVCIIAGCVKMRSRLVKKCRMGEESRTGGARLQPCRKYPPNSVIPTAADYRESGDLRSGGTLRFGLRRDELCGDWRPARPSRALARQGRSPDSSSEASNDLTILRKLFP
jgi:hypothetical protein